MTELTYTVPVVGEENKLAVPKVDTALTEIKTKFNGAVDKTNLAAEVPLIPSTAKYGAVKEFTAVEMEAGVELSASRPSFIYSSPGIEEVGGVVLSITKTAILVPAGSKVKTKAITKIQAITL